MKNSFAKRSLGQNFLVDESVIGKIISAINLTRDDTVIEIGPGRGALTEKLVESKATVIAIELDRELVPLLEERFEEFPNLTIIEADASKIQFSNILKTQRPKAKDQRPALIANLPYYISTAILQRLAEQRECFSSLVLMFQREVADRINAKPGNSERGFLTVIVEAAFSVERLFDVPPSAFQPEPKVWSSVVRLVPKAAEIDDEPAFKRLVSIAFAQKRKTIANNIKHAYPNCLEALDKAGIVSKTRAEQLTIGDWKRLFESLRG